jgi:hypothetical protein
MRELVAAVAIDAHDVLGLVVRAAEQVHARRLRTFTPVLSSTSLGP